MFISRLKNLTIEQNVLIQGLSSFDLIQQQNIRLQSTLQSSLVELKQLSDTKGRIQEQKKDQNFGIRMKMDQLLRKTIQEFDSDYHSKAVWTPTQSLLLLQSVP